MYVNKQTGEIVSRSRIKADHSATSFPRKIPADWLERNGYAVVIQVAPPPVPPGQMAVASSAEAEKINGVWQTKWILRDKTPEELEFIANQYKRERAVELRSLDGDGMDAMRKAIVALAAGQGVQLPAEFNDYLAKVDAIKAAHPKPQTKENLTCPELFL